MALSDSLKSVKAAFVVKPEQSVRQPADKITAIPESHAYQQGRPDIRTGFLLSAAGKAEQASGKPASGQTGTTLNRCLEIFNSEDPITFPSRNKNDYRIVNAVADVHFKGATGRTEGTLAEIREPANRARLKDSLAGLDTVVALGRKPHVAIKVSEFDGRVLKGSHPSMQNLNRNVNVTGRNARERGEARIAKYARSILSKKVD